jgi:hypothetical protein
MPIACQITCAIVLLEKKKKNSCSAVCTLREMNEQAISIKVLAKWYGSTSSKPLWVNEHYMFEYGQTDHHIS